MLTRDMSEKDFAVQGFEPLTHRELEVENRELRMALTVNRHYIKWLAENVPEGVRLINIYCGEWAKKYSEHVRGC